MIKGFNHSNANNRKGWKWLAEYIGEEENVLSIILNRASENNYSNAVRFNRRITNQATGRLRYTDIHVTTTDGTNQVLFSIEGKSHARINTQTVTDFAKEFVTDFLEFEELAYFWVYRASVLDDSPDIVKGHIMGYLTDPVTVDLFNQCKNSDVQAYTNKLEDLFNLAPGEDITSQHIIEYFETIMNADNGLTKFDNIFFFE